jgi:hypothetical protein
MIEAQSRYIAGMIAEVGKARDNGGSLKITPAKTVVDQYNEEIQSRLQKSTFASDNCRSWYKNSEGVITNNWCGNVIEYQNRLSEIDWTDFELAGQAASGVAKKRKSRIGRVVEETNSTLLPLLGVGATALLAATYMLRFRR